MTTAVVSLTSDLKRKRWMREGLLQSTSLSFWSQFTGRSMDSVVYQETNISAGDGHTVVFDFDGNLTGQAIKGKDTAYGKGEQKRKFSDKIIVDRYRLVVDNGDKFDGIDIGDLSINEHSDSRVKLGDLFMRNKDQGIFDAAQGFKDNVVPTHTIKVDATTSFSYNTLAIIEKALRTGSGYKTGAFNSTTNASRRAPLKAFRDADKRPAWLLVIDAYTAERMRVDSTMQTLLSQGDMRGPNNSLWKGILGRIGQLVIVEADTFFGSTTGNGLNGSKIEVSGMRQFDLTNSKWSGETGYDVNAASFYSRCLIMGAGAIQLAMGKMPDYRFQWSQDFKVKSESAVESYWNVKKTRLVAENTDYEAAKVAGIDYSIIPVDVKIT